MASRLWTLLHQSCKPDILNSAPPLDISPSRPLTLPSRLSSSQRELCWKRLEERSKRIIWVDYTASADASILELALIVTTHTLDEVERRAWTFSDGDVHSRDTEIVAFLHEHSAERPKVAGAASLSLLLPVLKNQLPDVHAFLDCSEPLDLGRGGVRRFAALIGRGLNATATDSELCEFESRQTIGAPAVRAQSGGINASGGMHGITHGPMDRAEAAILSLGWARETLIEPPKAKRYVTAALYAYGAMLAALTLQLGVRVWYAFSH